jgi:predicted metal-dependent phosphoesterase TrpH
MKADLHVHTRYSRDAVSSPKAILRMAQRREIDALAITDHDTTAGWREMVEGAKQTDIEVILGEERKVFRNGRIIGELICLFLSRPVESRDVSEAVSEVQDQGGIVCAAHPFDHRRVPFEETDFLKERGIAIELFNARTYQPRGNRMALAFAQENGSMITAGSDAHTPFEVGNAYIEADVQTLDELKEALIQRKVRATGRTSNPLLSCYSFMGRWGYVC